MDREYIVTLHRKEDLEQFYAEMQLTGFPLVLKRPLSRNTHYRMTDEQAETLRQDSRVLAVERTPEDLGYKIVKYSFVNNQSYTKSGNFWKDDTVPPATISIADYQWGHLHCAGNDAQRRKNTWGSGDTNESVNDSVSIFNEGRHVDVVIVDDPVSYDCAEWNSPSSGSSRFVQYDWFNELNQYVSSIDDDSQVLPTGSVTYYDNSSNPEFHGVHVAGTVVGQHYGWAREANIYALQILGTMPSGQSLPPLLLFDYLRAFHRNKPINPETGRRNPTITNHSWGYSFDISKWFPYGLDVGDIAFISSQGTIYDYNPVSQSNVVPPLGWNNVGMNDFFGLGIDKLNFPISYAAINADIEDAIEDGVVVIAAAGNENFEMVPPTDTRYNDYIAISSSYYDPNDPLSLSTIYWRQGSSPGCANGVICVGALSNSSDFRRSTYTNYGPRVDVFAPGDNIISAFNTLGLSDGKYGGSNYYYPIDGTSMASPQVAGIAACLASNNPRITNADILGYLNSVGKSSDMSFDLGDNEQDSFFIGGTKTYGSNPDHYGFVDLYPDRTGEAPAVVSGSQLYYYQVTYFIGDQLRILHPGGEIQSVNITGVDGTSAYIMDYYDNSVSEIQRSGSNPTLYLQEGDELHIDLDISISSHPIYIKTSLSSGNSNQLLGVYGQGVTANGSTLIWKTNIGDAGTYYYQCGNHFGMNGQIIVQPYGTYHTNSGGFYIKSSDDIGTSNAYTQGISNAGGTLDFNGILLWDTTGYSAGTYYCRDSQDSRWHMTIVLQNPLAPTSGSYSDTTCSKGSVNLYALCKNPRPTSGYSMPQKGNRTTGMTFPRPNVYHSS